MALLAANVSIKARAARDASRYRPYFRQSLTHVELTAGSLTSVLCNVFTGTGHRRQGIATAIVQHLMVQASETPVVSIASLVGVQLLNKLDFRSVGDLHWEKRCCPPKQDSIMLWQDPLASNKPGPPTAGDASLGQRFNEPRSSIEVQRATLADVPEVVQLHLLIFQAFRRAFDHL
jgi:hypothetical protein